MLNSLKNRNFFLLWIGLLISNIGTWSQMFVEQWYIYHLNNSAFDIGKLIAVQMLPNVLLMFIGGVLADRLNRKKILILTQSGMGIITLVIALFITFNIMNISIFLLLSFLYAALVAFDIPARRSLVPNIVPKEDLPNANALYSGTFQMAIFIGPIIGSIIIAKFGFVSVFYFNCITFLSIIYAVSLIRIPESGNIIQFKQSIFKDITFFIQAIKERHILLIFIIVGFMFNCIEQINYLIPPLIKMVKGDATQVGILNTMLGIGLIFGALFVALYYKMLKRKTALWLGISSIIIACVSILIVFDKNMWIVGIIFILRGIFVQIGATLVLSSLQSYTPNTLLGKVMGIYSASSALAELFALPVTFVAQKMNLNASFTLLGAISCIVLMIICIYGKSLNVSNLLAEEEKRIGY